MSILVPRAAPNIWVRTGIDGDRAPTVAAIPPDTPIMPRALPRREVGWVESPANAPTQQRDEARYVIW